MESKHIMGTVVKPSLAPHPNSDPAHWKVHVLLPYAYLDTLSQPPLDGALEEYDASGRKTVSEWSLDARRAINVALEKIGAASVEWHKVFLGMTEQVGIIFFLTRTRTSRLTGVFVDRERDPKE